MGEKNEMELAGYAGIAIAGLIGLKVLSQFLDKAKNKMQSWFAGNESTIVTDSSTNIDLLLPLAGAVALGIGIEEGLRYHYQKQAKQRIEYFQIVPHIETEVDKERITNLVNAFYEMSRPFFYRIARGQEWFQLYFVCLEDSTRDDGRIEIYCGFPRDRFSGVKKKLLSAFPSSGLKRVRWDEVPVLSKKGQGGYLIYRKQKRAGFPFAEFKGKDQITGILEQLAPGSAIAFSFSPTTPRQLKSLLRKTRKAYYREVGFDPKSMRKSDLDPDIKHEIDLLDARSRRTRAFDVNIAVWQEKESYGDIVSSLRNELNSRLGNENNGFYLKRTFRNPIQITPYSLGVFRFLVRWLERLPFTPFPSPVILVAAELANILQLPTGMTEEQRSRKQRHLYNRIDHILPGQSEIPANEFNEGVMVGYSLNLAQDYRPVYLLPKSMRKMGTVVGKTGGGKSAVALMACIDIILDRLKGAKGAKGGLTIIDPKQSLVYTLLTYLNKLKLEGVLTEEHEKLFRLYDVTSKEHCFSINPMEKTKKNMSKEEKIEIVKQTLEVLMSAYPNDSILFERYGSVAIRALLEDPLMDHTILAIATFVDKESPLRERLYRFLKNGNAEQKEIAREIERLNKGFGSTECQTVYNRLHRLANNPRTQRIFGQTKTSVDPLKSMEDGLITLYNVDGLDEDEMRLVMGYILMEYHKAASKRKNQASNHYLWVDEAHEVQLPVIWRKIIPKDREKGLCLWMLTQSFEQFNDALLRALTDIGGNFISCIAGEASAKQVQRITTGRVNASDLQNLRPLTSVIDTEDSSGDRVTFMVKVDPPYIWDKDGKKTYYGPDEERINREKNEAYKNAWNNLGRKWMERDCRKVTEVEAEISDYMEALWQTKQHIEIDESRAEVASTKDAIRKADNVVSFENKKAVGQNPFAHLVVDDEEAGEEENE